MPMFKRDVLTLADILQKCLRQDGLETPLQQNVSSTRGTKLWVRL